MATTDLVKYFAICKSSNQSIITQCFKSKSPEVISTNYLISIFKQELYERDCKNALYTLVNMKLSVGSKQKIKSPHGIWYCKHGQNDLAFFALVDLNYPEKFAMRMIFEMESFIQKSQYAKFDSIEQISKICKSPLEQLMKKYNDQKQLDKLSEAKQNVEMVTKEMNENISKMVEREANLQAIDNKAEQLSSSAFEFQNSATRLKRNMWLRSLKMKILIFLICLGVIFVLVFPFLGGGSDDDQEKPQEIKEGEENGNNNNRFLTI